MGLFLKYRNSLHFKVALFTLLTSISALSSTIASVPNNGIHFRRVSNWEEIKQLAAKEKKMIFIDLYTTWCAPCKAMAVNVFPQQVVGDFFNANFINVAVQMNKTKKDDSAVKALYSTVKYLEQTYHIDSYPTYLFFDENGTLVHKIIGASPSAEDFLEKSKMALQPATQFETLKKDFPSKKDPTYLLSLITAAKLSNNLKELPDYINAYLVQQKDLKTPQNIEFLLLGTKKSTDPGFDMLLHHSDIIDKVVGKGKSSEVLFSIIFDEELLPVLRKGGRKVDYGGGMVVYSGDLVKNFDWEKEKDALRIRYPSITDKVISYARIIYDDWQNDLSSYVKDVTNYLTNYPQAVSDDEINMYAWRILGASEDKGQLQSAIDWTKPMATNNKLAKGYYQYTYAALLYKVGLREQALKYIDNILENSSTKNSDLKSLVEKINRNQKAW